MDKQAYSIAEFVEIYGLNEATVRVNVTRSPETLPKVMRIGRTIRFTKEAIKAWEEQMQRV